MNAALTTAQAIRPSWATTARRWSFTPVTAAGGTAPVTFGINPARRSRAIGLSFSTGTGAVSGTPTGTLATTTFTVTATDNIGATSSRTFTLTVNAALARRRRRCRARWARRARRSRRSAGDGRGRHDTHTFGASPRATLTGIGLAFDPATGAVSGTPSAPLGLTTFTVTVTDNIGATSSRTFTLLVNGPLTTTQVVPSTVAQIGNAVTAFTPVTAGGGTAPYSFAITSGTLPAGMSINSSTGAVSGTPTTMLATTTFTVTVTDATLTTSSKTFDLTVNGIVLDLTAAAPNPVTNGTDVTIPLLIDMSNRGTDDIASIQLTVNWDPTRFTYKSSGAPVLGGCIADA